MQVESNEPFAVGGPQRLIAQAPALVQIVERSGQSPVVRHGYSQTRPPAQPSSTHKSAQPQSTSVWHGENSLGGTPLMQPLLPPELLLVVPPVEPPDVEPPEVDPPELLVDPLVPPLLLLLLLPLPPGSQVPSHGLPGSGTAQRSPCPHVSAKADGSHKVAQTPPAIPGRQTIPASQAEERSARVAWASQNVVVPPPWKQSQETPPPACTTGTQEPSPWPTTLQLPSAVPPKPAPQSFRAQPPSRQTVSSDPQSASSRHGSSQTRAPVRLVRHASGQAQSASLPQGAKAPAPPEQPLVPPLVEPPVEPLVEPPLLPEVEPLVVDPPEVAPLVDPPLLLQDRLS